MSGAEPEYVDLLKEGIEAGQFGGSIQSHGDHAMGFVRFPDRFTGRVADLGSGAGLPALVLAWRFPETQWLLIERRTSRADLLRRAIRRLGLTQRVEVAAVDAAIVGRGPDRATFDWVLARSFGSPGHTAECASPLLRTHGSLITSEPFDADIQARWPSVKVEQCGLTMADEWRTDTGRYIRLERNDVDIGALPRSGARKQPLF